MNALGKIEILTIKNRLDKLAKSDVFEDGIRSACSQAGSLLFDIRQIVLGGRSDNAIVTQLKELLAQQGEG